MAVPPLTHSVAPLSTCESLYGHGVEMMSHHAHCVMCLCCVLFGFKEVASCKGGIAGMGLC